MLRHSLRLALLAMALAACSDAELGAGTRPVELFLGVGGRQAEIALDECASTGLRAYLRFEGEAPDVGDYTNRSELSSSDPQTAFVSDGRTPSPDGRVLAAGVLIGIKPGTATITARYLDFTGTISVQVDTLSELRIEPALTDIAEDLPQKFDLIAEFDDQRPEQDASTAATWSFEPTTARAAVDDTGIVQANTARDAVPLTLVARLPDCAREARHDFRVSALAALELEYEFPDDARMPLGTSEAVIVYGRFAQAGSTRQNLSALAEVESVPDDFIAVTKGDGLLEGLTIANIDDGKLIVEALEDPQVVAFDIHVDSGEGFTQRTRDWTLLDLDLVELSLSPETQRVDYPDEGQLQAEGLFSNGMRRDITRHVAWTSSEPDFVVVSNSPREAGKVTVADVDLDAEIEASVGNEDDPEEPFSDTATVRVFPSTAR